MNLLLAWLNAHGIPIGWDGLFLGLILFLGAGYGMAVGRDRVALFTLASYVAYAVVTSTPLFGILSQYARVDQSAAMRVVWFGGIFALVFTLLLRSPLLSGFSQSKGNVVERVLLGISHVGLLVVMAIVLLPIEYTAGIGPLSRNIFSEPIGRSFWLLAPIVGFVVLGREGKTLDFADIDG